MPRRFSSDEGRTYFALALPVHPQRPGVQGHDGAHDEAHDGAHDGAHDDLTDTEARILAFVASQPRSRTAIAEHLGLTSRSGNLYKSIDHLRNRGFIELTIPDKPQSRNQKMGITEKGRAWLAAQPQS